MLARPTALDIQDSKPENHQDLHQDLHSIRN